jgi:uncharacterized iron-regulated membrane protein
MKKAMGIIHLYLGLTSGVVVVIVSITGCLYVYEEELKAWLYRDREKVSVPEHRTRKSLSELLTVAQLEAGADHPIQNIEIASAPDQTYSFRPMQIRDNKAYTHFGEIVYQRKIYIDPYTGEVVKNENTKYEFFTLVLRLHRNLLLNRQVGSSVVGTSVMMFVILLITGIVLWWPKNKLALKKSFSFFWKDTTRWKRKNYDLHSIFGFYGSFILLVIALTGLTWSFDWFDHSVQWLANGGVKAKKAKTIFSDTTKLATALPIDKVYAALIGRHPDARIITINLPEKAKGTINASIRKDDDVRYNAQRYQFDQFTGDQLTSLSFDEKNSGEKLRSMNYDIHVGAILGPVGKFLAFCASLISASLPVTGFLIWYGRRNKKVVGRKIPAVRQVAAFPS